MTPDGRPFFGGTYFPPEDRNGGEGFPTLLGRVVEAWRDHRPEIEKDADRLSALVKRTIEAKKSALGKTPLSRALAAAGRAALGEQITIWQADVRSAAVRASPSAVELASSSRSRKIGASFLGTGPNGVLVPTRDFGGW